MSLRVWIALTVIALTAGPAHAQLTVIDPANLAQAILIAQRTQRQLEELQSEYRTVLRMAQGLGNLQRYQTPSIALTAPDPGRWPFGRPWVQALVSGDARGTLYYDSVVPLQRPDVTEPSVAWSGHRRRQPRQREG